jgi:hypothetical protein
LGAATVVTLIGVGAIVAVLAIYLITIAVTLYRVHFNLGTIIVGVKAICLQVSVVPKYVGIIMNDVLAIDQAAKQLLAWGGDPEDMVEDPVIARMTLELQDVDDQMEREGRQPDAIPVRQ